MLISISEILGKSWFFYKNHWRHVLPYLLLFLLPTLLLSSVGLLGIYVDTYLPGLSFFSGMAILGVVVAAAVFSIWSGIAFAKAVYALLRGEQVPHWKEIFMASSSIIWPAFYTSLLVAFLVLIGCILLVVPGIIFAVWYMFSFYEVVFNGKKGMAALRASKALVVGRWWAMIWRWIVPSVVFGALGMVAQYILMLPVEWLIHSTLSYYAVSSLISTVVNIAYTPFLVAAITLLYISAKQTPVTSPQTPSAPPQS